MIDRSAHARVLFSTLGPTYDRAGALLSLGQDPRWRRFLVSRLPGGAGESVLDVATGTGLVAERLLARGYAVTGIDQSPEMLAVARRRFGPRVVLVEADAGLLPFADDSFDHLTCTYLLRYVDDPAAVLAELARVVRPGGTIAMLEFGVPSPPWHSGWSGYVDWVLPAASRLLSPGWREVGRFLGPSIRDFWARWPAERLLSAWRDAGVENLRVRRLTFGAGVVVWGTKTLAGGGTR